MKALDWPPLWTLGCVALGWIIARIDPLAVGGAPLLALVVFLFAVAMTIWAAATMARSKTTVVPRKAPEALVTSGPFRWSRNPIYLSDLLVVVAAAIWFGSPVAALLAVPLALILRQRFIMGEEDRLAEFAPDAWVEYSSRTRRWI